jgi:ribose/xylose/arabinose/galactoside ABC-type transport system permease subunit
MKAASTLEAARGIASRGSPFIGLVAVVVIGALISPVFLTFENLANFARTASIMGLVAIGMTFVILCGSIDLSVSSVFSLSGFLFILLSKYSILLAICAPLAAGLLIGLFNGTLITRLSIPAFVATLATMIFVRGLVLVVTNETTFKVAGLSPVLYFLGRGTIFTYVSFPLLMFISAILIASFVLRRRPIGRAMYIVGGNAEAARMMGVSVTRTMTTAHAVCGVMAAYGGIFLASRVGAAYPLSGTGYELYAIAAVVIGGARLTGGIGKMSGTVSGTLIMGAFSNIFNLQRFLNPVWELVVVGCVLLAVIFLQSVIETYGVKSKTEGPAGGKRLVS